MSLQYDALHDGIVNALETMSRLNEAQQRLDDLVQRQIDELWKDNAELRDELHAVANRVETLTRATFACTPDESGGLRDASN